MPLVSVIIPTFNRSSILRRTLDALTTQTYPLQQVEVLVIADGCTDNTIKMLCRYGGPFALHMLEQSSKGPAKARNQGAACATGQLLIFLDDDIEAASGFIEAHVRAHERWPGHVIIGYLPVDLPGRTDFFSVELKTWWESMFHAMRQPGHRYTYRDLLTGNFSIETELFKKTGGFDPAFWCHEDYEFGMRLIKAGIPLMFAADALGYHHEMTDLDRSLQRKYQEGETDVMLGFRHPELRSVLPLAQFRNSFSTLSHLLFTLAFKWPEGDNALIACLRLILGPLEKVKARRHWRLILNYLLVYSYWLGVAKELGSIQALENFLKDSLSNINTDSEGIEIDLRDGLKVAEEKLDQERPGSAQIRYGRYSIGQILLQPGAERLRGTHLRPILANKLAKPLFKALALEGAIGLDIDPEQVLAACSLKSLEPIPEC